MKLAILNYKKLCLIGHERDVSNLVRWKINFKTRGHTSIFANNLMKSDIPNMWSLNKVSRIGRIVKWKYAEGMKKYSVSNSQSNAD